MLAQHFIRPAHRRVWILVAVCALLCAAEAGLRLGAASPDARYTLPQFSLGYFWGNPLGWTGVLSGVTVNKDSVQFASLAGFFRDQPVPVPPQDNVYVRFAGYALLGSALAPLVGLYASFVIINLALWIAGALATYALAIRRTGSALIAVLAALLVTSAPAFEALSGQALPYVASYGLFALALLFFDVVGVFDHRVTPRTALASGLVGGMTFLFYDLYMLPAFVLLYGLLRRTPLSTLALMIVAMAVPRLVWSGYWQAAQLPSYAHNEQHPVEALAAWFDTARTGEGLSRLKAYVLLVMHGVLNISAAFLVWPVLLAVWELWCRRRSASAHWFVAVAVGGFAPALFMLSTWPHIPRWYGYGFPAVYILAAAAAVRIGSSLFAHRSATVQVVTAVAVLLPAIVLANLDVLGFTRAMELVLFQPTHWSYLWSR